jgi:6-pyruvoyltetrahydropterin/6-carboxytetrahydropterin synthase
MMEASLIRTVRFHARHRYWRAAWSEEHNRSVFGPNVESHSHDWTVEVTVRGPIDEQTGFVVDLAGLDARLRELVEPLEGSDLDEAVPEARSGEIMPSTECLARWFWSRLAGALPGSARLVRVRVAESETLAAVYEGGSPRGREP